MRRSVLAAVLIGTLALAGCSSAQQPQDTTGDATQESQDRQETTEEQEPEVDTASVGEPVTYEANGGGEFIVTVDGFERSAESTEQSFGDEGYSDCYLLLTIEDVSVDTSDNPYTQLARLRLEDSDGVTMNSASSGFNIGEYGIAFDYSFEISEGQAVRVCVPFTVPDDKPTDYTVIIDEVQVPVTLVDSDRPIS